jgi:hypothetical protein
MDVRTSLPAAAIAIGCVVLVVARVALAPGPPPRRQADPAERRRLAAAVAASERTWSTETAQTFPEDLWSQRDDFHGRELRKVKELAGENDLPVEDVLRAIDEDLHRTGAPNASAPDDRNARAIPCKPRPFYD